MPLVFRMAAGYADVVKFLITSAFFHYFYDSINFDQQRHQSYDFIVIGGGTAGALVATRLSENPEYTVLLLERGGNSGNYFTEIPYVSEIIGYDGPWVKLFKSVKQTYACGKSNGICSLYTGGGLGGGSTINGLSWVRGSPKDYDDWEEKYGAEGWSYADVVPFFKKVENFLSKKLAANKLLGTTQGGINITNGNSYPSTTSTLLEGFSKADFHLGNYNGIDPAKVSLTQVTVANGKRWSSWNTFLKPVVKRKNLDILTFADVQMINFDSDKRAISVSYRKDGKVHETKVTKEVVVSAGAIDSPKILQLSGIGDKNKLKSVGVKRIVANLPSVGQSFQDRLGVIVNVTTNDRRPAISLNDYKNYQESKSGPLVKHPYLILAFLLDKLTSVDKNDTRIEYEILLGR